MDGRERRHSPQGMVDVGAVRAVSGAALSRVAVPVVAEPAEAVRPIDSIDLLFTANAHTAFGFDINPSHRKLFLSRQGI
ncbi:hypothetical protein ACFWF7_20510 [Nocardia sp. NPDC060256]|uniref:hypothetical protein n=1 Tax=unclassified Nocardia TaxID=2637762 RepID=UPI0036466CB3